MRTHFFVARGSRPLEGRVIYNAGDSAFDFEPAQDQGLQRRTGGEGVTSLLIGTLQIEVGIETNTLLYVWGYQPRVSWKLADLTPPAPVPGSISIQIVDKTIGSLDPGISIGLIEIGEWPVQYNPSTGWVCVGSTEFAHPAQAVEFASNTVAVIRDKLLTALWLRPIVGDAKNSIVPARPRSLFT